jgi:hypothetical protein
MPQKRRSCLLRIVRWLLAIWVMATASFSAAATGTERPAAGQSSTPTLVFIVPGTYGNDQFWTNVIEGKATFASEFRRALGPNTEIYPFLWHGSNDHASREAAAQDLAETINRKIAQAAGSIRICLVGHSHGGNIALRAAGLCRHADIDTIVCISTPHAYLKMRSPTAAAAAAAAAAATSDDDDQPPQHDPLRVPIYCTWDARQHTKTIVTLCPAGDSVPALWSSFSKGLSRDATIPLTRSWQEHLNFPRLLDDTFLSHHFFDPGDIIMGGALTVADVNVTYPSMVDGGLRQHSSVHSRRMGFVIGQLLRAGASPAAVEYVRTLIQPSDADWGEPVPQAQQDRWARDHAADFSQVGWRFDRAEIHLDPSATQRAGNWDGSAPQPYVRLDLKGSDGRRLRHDSDCGSTWAPGLIVWNDQTASLAIRASHCWCRPDADLGTAREIIQKGGEATPPDEVQDSLWTARLRWTRLHY